MTYVTTMVESFHPASIFFTVHPHCSAFAEFEICHGLKRVHRFAKCLESRSHTQLQSKPTHQPTTTTMTTATATQTYLAEHTSRTERTDHPVEPEPTCQRTA